AAGVAVEEAAGQGEGPAIVAVQLAVRRVDHHHVEVVVVVVVDPGQAAEVGRAGIDLLADEVQRSPAVVLGVQPQPLAAEADEVQVAVAVHVAGQGGTGVAEGRVGGGVVGVEGGRLGGGGQAGKAAGGEGD